MRMMMIGGGGGGGGGGDAYRWPNPTVEIPAWDYHLDEDNPSRSMIHNISPEAYDSAMAASQSYAPANESEDDNSLTDEFELPLDVFSSDNFRMFDFKVKRCTRARSHDWTECPFAHPGEKARRRDPRKCHYSGSPCPDFRKGGLCKRGDYCEFSHGVFECWLHPSRYRTQPCKDGIRCRRRVCFFAHTPNQLRLPPYTTSPDTSPGRPESFNTFTGSFSSTSPSITRHSINQLSDSITKMRLGMNSNHSPPSWKTSPSSIRVLPFTSLPSTPIPANGEISYNMWDNESSRIIRVDSPGIFPDVGWISELIE